MAKGVVESVGVACDLGGVVVPSAKVLTASPGRWPLRAPACIIAAALLLAGGCAQGPHLIPVVKRELIDREVVEYPNDQTLTPFITGLTAPCAIGFENDNPTYKGSIIIAESGSDDEPRIYGFKPNGEQFWIYPKFTRVPLLDSSYRMYGPIGGLAMYKGKIYVSHRNAEGMGMISALDYEGHHSTIVSELPAQGDYAVTDLAIHPSNGRLYFGVGAATNSGVVGLDNWEEGWVNKHPNFSDRPFVDLKLNGYRFSTPNPKGGLFGGDDIAVTAPFQAFGASRLLRIPASPVKRPTAAIYSVNIDGGDPQVEAHGIRLPRGLVFNEFGNLFVTDDGMELRGTRPVKDDPDTVLRVPLGGQIWYGWPDYSADLRPIGELPRPPELMLLRTGYPELAAIIDHESSGLIPPDRNALLRAIFPALSGAAKMTFVPESSDKSFAAYRGSLIVALSGDRAPFANSGQPLVAPQGYMVKRVELDSKQVSDFIVNAKRSPASKIGNPDGALERPIDVKFGPDGALYIVDYGQMVVKDGHEQVKSRTGKIFRLGVPAVPTTAPASADDDNSGIINYQR
ncbi:MAG: hypothetical protein ACTHLZ_19825 [Tepidisphaeraceae bacterium]